MITNTDKIEALQNKINMLNLHITSLREDILESPFGDNVEKPTRQAVLDDILSIIEALEIEKIALTNQG